MTKNHVNSGLLLLLALMLGMSSCASNASREAKMDAFTSASTVRTEAPSIVDDIPPMEGKGKTLVVYFTSGNAAQRVALDLVALYSADLEKIEEVTVRKGGWGFMTAGAASTFNQAVAIKPPVHDPSGYDRVFVLTPVWAWRLSPPVRTWLRMFKGRLPDVAFATISGDTKPEKIVASMAREGGRQPFASAGFSEADFKPANRAAYLDKVRQLISISR